jgi:GT2 family glycosyltransferase
LHGHLLSEAPTETKEIWGTCFGCALIRKEAFEQCGPLDPDFFAEWDDVDFSLRARWHGWKFLLIPEARVLHHRSPTSNRDPQAKLVRLRRNQMLTYTKDLPLSMALVRLGYRFQYDLSMSLHYFRHGELSGVWQSWREWFAFLPRMLARRKQVRRTARLSSRQMKQQIRSFTHGA